MSIPPKARSAVAVSIVAGVVAMLCAGPAAAHVNVDAGQQPPQGGYGIVRLVVPTESDTASTVALTVTLPDGVDLTTARTLPVAGWAATVDTVAVGDAHRVSRISWRSLDAAAGVKPGEFGEFAFSAGPWPTDADTVALPTDQSYSDGTVVSWNEIAVDKDSEPEHPAPAVTLTSGGHGHGGGHDPAPSAAPAAVDVAHTALASPAGESWLWRAATLVSLAVALGTAGALAVVLRRSRGTGP